MRLCFKASPHPRVEIQTADRGPGMGEGEKEFADGYSEGRVIGPDAPRRRGQGLGVGLGTVRRLMDEVRITTDADGAHCIVAARWTER
jgi:anti-sigma regulatory factor (Ser/Thr protein kinase)